MKQELYKAFNNGEKFEIISINRLNDLQNELNKFREDSELNDFQKWIVDDLYNYNIPDVDFDINSIILVAVPHPLYADVELIYKNKKFNTLSVVMSDFKSTEECLKKIHKENNYNYIAAESIPLKRLAVHCGLAEYGRNNICYIDGLGSLFSFVAFFSEIKALDNHWNGIKVANKCDSCKACLRNCPTGAIKEDSFLIDTDRCLTFWNESSEPFPSWIPKSAHHCIYDCIKCQLSCPMNKDLEKKARKTICFSEEEARVLLYGLDHNKQSLSFKRKVDYLGLNEWPDGIPKNLRILFNIDSKIHIT